MNMLGSLVALLMAAAVLLAASRRLPIPYPTMLALLGIGAAYLPFAPQLEIDPQLALALFIAPALLDAGYDTSPRELAKLWRPLAVLAIGAVLLTAAIVGLIGWWVAGLPIAAAIALGAIVAPPDAAAANAVLGQVDLPRRSLLVLRGESLLNDAAALILFGAAVTAATDGPGTAVQLALAVPGGLLLGVAAGFVYARAVPLFAGTLSVLILEFTATIGLWLLTEHLHLSPILAIVSFAMMIARNLPKRQSARDRVQSYAVWAAVVFILNVLAFLLMGAQVRRLVGELSPAELQHHLGFAALVLAAVVAVRFAVVLGYRAISGIVPSPKSEDEQSYLHQVPPWRASVLVSWAGMRGLVTVATAFALPEAFPQRDLIVFAAFGVVLGTLVLQGATLVPLTTLLRLPPDTSLTDDLRTARIAMLEAGRKSAQKEAHPLDTMLVARIDAAIAVARERDDPQDATRFDRGTGRSVAAQRAALLAMRADGSIHDDVFHKLEEELDWLELAARPNSELEVHEA